MSCLPPTLTVAAGVRKAEFPGTEMHILTGKQRERDTGRALTVFTAVLCSASVFPSSEQYRGPY